MSAQLVYVKTPKGIEEINSRSYGLPQRVRQILIMMDGKRSLSDVAAILPEDDGETLLKSLVTGGFIVPLQSVGANSQGTPVDKFVPPQDIAQRFEMARNLMRNTINAFLGGMGSSLLNQLDKCTNLDELRVHYKAWQDAILLSSDGRKQAEDLENRLAALLS
jgi:hypothetical protein